MPVRYEQGLRSLLAACDTDSIHDRLGAEERITVVKRDFQRARPGRLVAERLICIWRLGVLARAKLSRPVGV